MRKAIIHFLYLILITGLVLQLSLVVSHAAEHTTPIVWSNKKEYDPSETVNFLVMGLSL